ncbi:methylated-DNA--[protein]-cysteine S-methyltransferase [Neomicrococcus lactis]
MKNLEIVTEEILGHPFHAVMLRPDNAVVASGFGDLGDLIARLSPQDQSLAQTEASEEAIERQWLREYASGNMDSLKKFSVQQTGSEFYQLCWQTLRDVAPGQPLSYSQFAQAAGRPSAIRAAASTCARNLVALIVPCHRVIRTDGSAGNYLFGTKIKEELLKFESESAAA